MASTSTNSSEDLSPITAYNVEILDVRTDDGSDYAFQNVILVINIHKEDPETLPFEVDFHLMNGEDKHEIIIAGISDTSVGKRPLSRHDTTLYFQGQFMLTVKNDSVQPEDVMVGHDGDESDTDDGEDDDEDAADEQDEAEELGTIDGTFSMKMDANNFARVVRFLAPYIPEIPEKEDLSDDTACHQGEVYTVDMQCTIISGNPENLNQ